MALWLVNCIAGIFHRVSVAHGLSYAADNIGQIKRKRQTNSRPTVQAARSFASRS